jgi:hypothetical protein
MRREVGYSEKRHFVIASLCKFIQNDGSHLHLLTLFVEVLILIHEMSGV